jgi:hypothetical protein
MLPVNKNRSQPQNIVMLLWLSWWNLILCLRSAFSRYRAFLWFAAVLAAFCVRGDLRGVMSFLRALGLRQQFYDRRVDFFHSPAVVMPKLTSLWTDLVLLRVLKHDLLMVNGFQATVVRLDETPLNLGTDNASAAKRCRPVPGRPALGKPPMGARAARRWPGWKSIRWRGSRSDALGSRRHSHSR